MTNEQILQTLKDEFKTNEKTIEKIAETFGIDFNRTAKIYLEIFEELGINIMDDYECGDFKYNKETKEFIARPFVVDVTKQILAENLVFPDLEIAMGFLFKIYQRVEKNYDFFYKEYYEVEW